jgi:hypothetical protein
MKVLKEFFQFFKEAKADEKAGFIFFSFECLLIIATVIYISLFETILYLSVLGLIISVCFFVIVGVAIGLMIAFDE